MLDFSLRLPTTHWFLQCYLVYGRFTANGSVAKTASFIADLTLLDHDLLAYIPSLRAQCCLVLAVSLQQVQAEKRKPQARGTEAAEGVQVDSAVAPADSTLVPQIAGLVPQSDALQHWDRSVRDRVCQGTTAVDAAMCMQEVARVLQVLRRQWKDRKSVV